MSDALANSVPAAAPPPTFAPVNGHLVGIVMKELVRRAIEAIRVERFTFEAQNKMSLAGAPDDLVTSADRKAQEVYVRGLRECFPGVGIIGEEDALSLPCTLAGTADAPLYFTVDPLDGTRAFARRQSFGIGTMLALVHGAEVIGAYVGDVMTREIFGFRPGSEKVHRISEYDKAEQMRVDPERTLAGRYLFLRDLPEAYSPAVRALVQKGAGRFRGVEVASGSIGIGLARLWKDEVGAAALRPAHDTPWDWAPVVGISRALGFVFLRPEGGVLREYQPALTPEVERREHDVVIVHRSRVAELMEWAEA